MSRVMSAWRRACGKAKGDRVKIAMSGKFCPTGITARAATCRNMGTRKSEEFFRNYQRARRGKLPRQFVR